MSNITPEDRAIMLQWAFVLRSGRYKQAWGRFVTSNGCYCATGAYMHACGQREHIDDYGFNVTYADLAEDLPWWRGSIYKINDSGCASFHDIANLLEAAARTDDWKWLHPHEREENLEHVKERL